MIRGWGVGRSLPPPCQLAAAGDFSAPGRVVDALEQPFFSVEPHSSKLKSHLNECRQAKGTRPRSHMYLCTPYGVCTGTVSRSLRRGITPSRAASWHMYLRSSVMCMSPLRLRLACFCAARARGQA